jgi:hypothetical protein
MKEEVLEVSLGRLAVMSLHNNIHTSALVFLIRVVVVDIDIIVV